MAQRTHVLLLGAWLTQLAWSFCSDVAGYEDPQCANDDDEQSLLAIRTKVKESSHPELDTLVGPVNEEQVPGGALLDPDVYSGKNLKVNYTYMFKTDCYGDGTGRGYPCPEGTWCQVEARPNWYPWDVSYINRGRCVPYQPLGGACEEAFEGETAFPRKADGEFFSRPVHCGPEKDAVCTGEDFSKVLPPMCVAKRDPREGCMSSAPFCAGRPKGGCPPQNASFCVCPKGATGIGCRNSPKRVTKKELEQCGSVFNSFQGSNFGFAMGINNNGLPDDNDIAGGTRELMFKLEMQHGTNSGLANNILKKLWPYPVCEPGETALPGDANGTEGNVVSCTMFPLKVTERDPDGGLTGNYTDGTKAAFLPKHGGGVVDYHCSWMVMHTLSFNGDPVLTPQEEKAFGEMLMYVSGQFDCKVCRNHFVDIIRMYGLPTGNVRETYARWLWRAHNIANEHTYATHSPGEKEIIETEAWAPKDRRSSDWGNPNYEHPWYMTFNDALELWSGIIE